VNFRFETFEPGHAGQAIEPLLVGENIVVEVTVSASGGGGAPGHRKAQELLGWSVRRFCRRLGGGRTPPAAAVTDSDDAAPVIRRLRIACTRSSGAADDAGPPQHGMDEAYQLSLGAAGGAQLHAGSRHGVNRGLETLLSVLMALPQLGVAAGSSAAGLPDAPARARGSWVPGRLVVAGGEAPALLSLVIEDRPRHGWRGILVDTARHYLPMVQLERLLSEMAAVKMNVLHLHLTDAVSFPLQLESLPELAAHGAFSAEEQYTTSDVRRLVALAGNLSIRVVPEVDIPAHTASWQKGIPEIVAACDWLKPMDLSQADNPFKQMDLLALDPSNVRTAKVVGKLLSELAKLFPDTHVHVGGDEMDFRCWETHPKVRAWMKEQRLSPRAALQQFYDTAVFPVLKENGRVPMMWEDAYVAGLRLPPDAIVQPWKCWGRPAIGRASAARATLAGQRVVQSTCWYLDWDSSYADFARVEASEGVDDGVQHLVLGGEAALWTERIDWTNAECRLWPRAAAVAWQLWSPAGGTAFDSVEVGKWHTLRQWHRGVGLTPLGGARFQTDDEEDGGGGDEPLSALKAGTKPSRATLKEWCSTPASAVDKVLASVESCPAIESQAVQRGQQFVARSREEACAAVAAQEDEKEL
jgi:hexosaminidase